MAKHTSGPWRIDHDDREGMAWNSHIVDASGNRICFMSYDGTEQNARGLANARLIAAAPDIAEALTWFLEDTRFQVAVGGNPIVVDKMLTNARTALAKARGEA